MTINIMSLLPAFLFIWLSLSMKSGFGLISRGEEVNIKCIKKERQALLMIKEEIIDEVGRLSSWGNEEHQRDCCKWRGVSCNNQTGHVVRLNLQVTLRRYVASDHMPLRGRISASLLELQHLNCLNLSFNDFGGQQIPEFFGSLNKLRHLDLSHANFSGRIPYQLGNLSRLQSLDLSSFLGDMYTDKLEWLSHLSSLRQLALNRVDLSAAKDWLQVLSGLPSLTNLELGSCNLSSVSTSSISFPNSSKFLAFLDLSGNYLSNSIYSWLLHYSSSLVNLDLSSNSLLGPIPNYIFSNMTSLMHLHLRENQINAIPESFRNLCRLKILFLHGNHLTGKLFDLFSNLSGCTKDSLKILNLRDNKLSGSLPDFTIFSSLEKLYLQRNRLNGSFPKSFGQLSKLTKLDLSKNQLWGSILPDFSALSSLKELRIDYNRLNGTLTQSIGLLSKLEVLSISSNSLNGPITEAHMSNLSRLKDMDLSFNSLSLNFSIGWVPPFQLKYIGLAGCKVGPHFPKWLHTQNSSSWLDISNTGISDTMPNWFWDLSPMLYYLNLSHNQICGTIPDLSQKFFGNLAIDLSSNSFKGSIPPVPPSVVLLDFSKNMFSGSISFLCGITGKNLVVLDLSDNQLSGEMPSCFMDWQLLVIWYLANNNFSGKIPDKMDSNCNIRALDLHNNSLIGELPSALKNCSSLTIIDLGNNKLSGTIPAWVGGSLSNSTVISLRSNRFHGNMPIQLCNLKKLQVLDLSKNNISGTIPKCLNNLTALTVQNTSSNAITLIDQFDDYGDVRHISPYQGHISLVWKGKDYEYESILGLVKSIDLSDNKLYGNIPEEVTSLEGLISLNLSRNSLSGPIPPKIGQLNLLNALDLSNNLLTGKIPESFSQLDSLGALNLSNNKLSGKIPTSTKPQSFDASTYMGNSMLCGSPLRNKCLGDEPTQEPDITMSDNEDGFITQGFYISMVFGFIIGFWGVCGTLLLKKSMRYAYFKFLNDMNDKAYVLIAVNVAKLRRRFES